MLRKNSTFDRRPRFYLEIQPTVVVASLEKFGLFPSRKFPLCRRPIHRVWKSSKRN